MSVCGFSRQRILTMIGAAALLSIAPALSKATILYQNGFEPGDPGTRDFYDSTTNVQGSNIAIVANGGGQLGLTAASGTHYAEITNTDDAYSISQGPTYPLGYGQSVYTDYGQQALGNGVLTGGTPFYESTAYYLNANWALPAATFSPAFWIDTTPNTDPGFNDECNFRITMTTLGQIVVSAFAGNPGSNATLATISTSGWYTFKTTFEDDGGFVANTMSILDASNNVLGTFTGVTTLPYSDLTGTNYGDWTTVWQNGFGATVGPNENGAADVLGIDDVQVGTVPEPASFSLICLGAPALLIRRRRKVA